MFFVIIIFLLLFFYYFLHLEVTMTIPCFLKHLKDPFYVKNQYLLEFLYQVNFKGIVIKIIC